MFQEWLKKYEEIKKDKCICKKAYEEIDAPNYCNK